MILCGVFVAIMSVLLLAQRSSAFRLFRAPTQLAILKPAFCEVFPRISTVRFMGTSVKASLRAPRAPRTPKASKLVMNASPVSIAETETLQILASHPILKTLNQDQIRAATSFAQPSDPVENILNNSKNINMPKVSMVLAGAGSGKTRVLVHRIAYLLQELKVNPNAILATTFTNKAAREIKERIHLLLHPNSSSCDVDPLAIVSPTAVSSDQTLSASDAALLAAQNVTLKDPLPHWIGTFHSLCYKILLYNAEAADMEGCHMIDEAQQKAVVKKLMLNWEEEVEKKCNLDFGVAVDRCISYINKRKDNGIRASTAKKNAIFTPDVSTWVRKKYPSNKDAQQAFFLLMYDIYEKHCKREKLIDFNEVLLRTQELFMYRPKILERYRKQFQYIHVDEFQDTNGVQYSIIKLLISGPDALRNSTASVGNASNTPSTDPNTQTRIVPSALEANVTSPGPSLFVVGDDDQAIYGFRGAKADIMQRVGRDYPHSRLIKLEQNYRSTHTILRAANSVINKNEIRLGKSLWTHKHHELDEKVHIFQAKSEYEEADFVSHEILRRISAGPDAITLRKNVDARVAKSNEKRSFGLNDVAILVRTRIQFNALEQSLLHNGIPYILRGGSNFYTREEIQYVLMYLKLLQNRHNNHAFAKIANFPARGVTPTVMLEVEEFASANNMSMWDAATELTQRALNPDYVSTPLSVASIMDVDKDIVSNDLSKKNVSESATGAKEVDWMANLFAEIDATVSETVDITPTLKGEKAKKAKKVKAEKVKPPPKAIMHLAEFLKMIDSLDTLTARLPVNDVVKLTITQSGVYDHYHKGSQKDTKLAVKYLNRVVNLQELGAVVDERFEMRREDDWVKQFSAPLEGTDFDARRAEKVTLDPLGRTPLQVFLDDVNFDDDHHNHVRAENGATTGRKAVQIFTIHGVKGLEFPVVFLCGAEEGILPFRNADKGGSAENDNDNDIQDPEEVEARGVDKGIEESRRLFYVGVTRARELLFISHATSRMKDGLINGNVRPSMFLYELDKDALVKAQK